ncbi:MFS transporter [Anoxybacillus rupiensis]|uniref:MFS transporter n=1 Tax=Anoxybacteroides rupiense TaxID=311460 RepID=A0ABD5ISE7_9BACL|nr:MULTISPECIES: MFS transporter [Anoxybacillus]KXG08841.1 putative 3-phenylpropionic acid transporter [Anoxybacillus sp. P3H1B]MBS2771468.1 MFS transporter [Anoxybacillus rupiensis]MDE8564689.1 MFS transporter [Anoxybacillus rupiensis]MED5051209.1 MFS transporter [Anoxybacillus rupiensis]OQM45543.1 MFS transporter [Anoxybacillus sp. UARK-01]
MEVSARREILPLKIVFLLVYFCTFFGFGAFFPLLSVYLKNEMKLSGTEIGMIMSISPIVTIFIQPLWGMICDYTKKPVTVLTTAFVLTALFSVMYSSVHQYTWIVVMAVLLAFTQSAIVPISDSITLNYVQKTSGNYGSIRLWGSIGFAFAGLVGGWLSETFSLVAIFYILTFMLLLSAGLAWKLPREGHSMNTAVVRGMAQLFKIPKFVLFLAAAFLVFGPIYANNFYFGVFVEEMGGTLTGVGFAFLLAAGSEAPFMKMTDKLTRRYGMITILAFAATVSALRWFFYFFEPPLWLIYVTTVAQGFSVGLFIPVALQYVRETAPESVRVTAVSLYSAVSNGLGSWFCTVIGGYILDKSHASDIYWFFSLLTVAGLAILAIIALWDRKRMKDIS